MEHDEDFELKESNNWSKNLVNDAVPSADNGSSPVSTKYSKPTDVDSLIVRAACETFIARNGAA